METIYLKVINCYVKRENYKVLKFDGNNSTYFKINVSHFYVVLSNKRRSIKF